MNNNYKLIAFIIVIIIIIAIFASPISPFGGDDKPEPEPAESPAPFTTLMEYNGEVNFEATIENGPANEVTIAVNPKDPDNLIAGGKDYTLGPSGNGYIVWSGYYWSEDGGKTWGNGLIWGYMMLSQTLWWPLTARVMHIIQDWLTSQPLNLYLTSPGRG
jgi:hypothetical protein